MAARSARTTPGIQSGNSSTRVATAKTRSAGASTSIVSSILITGAAYTAGMWFRRAVDVAFVVAVVLGALVLVAAFLAGR
jgi:hypothetical protein